MEHGDVYGDVRHYQRRLSRHLGCNVLELELELEDLDTNTMFQSLLTLHVRQSIEN
jgi:hypothetical protein